MPMPKMRCHRCEEMTTLVAMLPDAEGCDSKCGGCGAPAAHYDTRDGKLVPITFAELLRRFDGHA